MKQYTDQQLQRVEEHCRAEVEARRHWASNISNEWQEKLSMEALVFANDAFCTPIEQQVARLLDHFYRRSHEIDNGRLVYADIKRQWDAALEGEMFEGEFSFFANSYPKSNPSQNFNISPPGC